MKKILVAACSVFILTACQTQNINEMSYAEIDALAQQIMQRCTEQGFPDKHPQRQACIKHEVDREILTRHNNRIRQRNIGLALANASSAYGQGLQQQRSRMVTCNSNRYGNQVTTNCY